MAKKDKVFTFNPQTAAQIKKNPISKPTGDDIAPDPNRDFPVKKPDTPAAPGGAAPGGDNKQEVPTVSTVDPNQDAIDARAAAKALKAKNSIAIMRARMAEYGLQSLMSLIEGYATEGYDDDTIAQLIKTTPQYAERFPAMAALSKKNRAISEAEYITFEREASQFERAYGLPAGMLSKSTVTTLLENEVSARELEERVTMAASGAFQTSAEVKRQFKNFYGIDSGGLTAYFLDPEKALPLLNKQYASAQIGAAAAGQGVAIAANMAEDLTVAGVNSQAATEGFGNVAAMKGLSTGRGEVVSQDELIKGNLLGSQEAQEKITRTAKSRTGRFEGGGSFASDQGQNVGLGTAATR